MGTPNGPNRPIYEQIVILDGSGFMYLTPAQAILLDVTTRSDADAVGWSRGLRA